MRKPSIAVLTTILLVLSVPIAHGEEDIARALQRIRSRPHHPMPIPTQATATGGEGNGLTLVNDTRYTLQAYFRGPVTRRVVLRRNSRMDVALAVGAYQVGVEARGTSILPFFGQQEYQSGAHYWLTFRVARR